MLTSSPAPVNYTESAAKTALLLNEGTLDGAHLHVTSESLSSTSSVSGEEGISQEDKPKVRKPSTSLHSRDPSLRWLTPCRCSLVPGRHCR